VVAAAAAAAGSEASYGDAAADATAASQGRLKGYPQAMVLQAAADAAAGAAGAAGVTARGSAGAGHVQQRAQVLAHWATTHPQGDLTMETTP
jgi:hypothetical protein